MHSVSGSAGLDRLAKGSNIAGIGGVLSVAEGQVEVPRDDCISGYCRLENYPGVSSIEDGIAGVLWALFIHPAISSSGETRMRWVGQDMVINENLGEEAVKGER